MSVDTKKRLILRNLLHINCSADSRRPRINSGMYIQVTADLWPSTPRPRTRGSGAALPYQKRVQRAIGHITGVRSTTANSACKDKAQVATFFAADESMSATSHRLTLRYRRSSTAPNPGYPGTDLLYRGDNRKSSSETRNSSSPDDANVNSLSNRIRRKDNRPSSRNKHRTSHSNGLIPLEKSDVELPSVLDENITGTRLNLPPQHLKGGRATGRLAVLKPLNSSEQLAAPVQPTLPPHRHTNPLSISSFAKPEAGAEETNEAGWTQTQNAKVPTVTKPPVLTSHQPNNNNSNSATSSSSQSTGQSKSETNGTLSSLAVTATGSTTYSVAKRSSRQPSNSQTNSGSVFKQPLRKTASSSTEAEAKYADPIAGSSPSFQARLSELASLEAETVRYERLRRLKKKNKDKDD